MPNASTTKQRATATPVTPPAPADDNTYIRHTICTDLGMLADVQLEFDSRSRELEEPDLIITFTSGGIDRPYEDVNVQMSVADAYELPRALELAIRKACEAGAIPPPEGREAVIARRARTRRATP